MVVNKNMIKELKEFEDAFSDGVYAVPRSPGEPKVKVRALWEYCQERGLEPKELGLDEIQQFLEY